MWTVPGKPVNIDHFKPFRPLQVLYEFDGPKTFTHQDQDGELYLAHWCDEDQDIVRYIVVPFSDELRKRLENGQMTIRQALDEPRVWVLDIDRGGNVSTAVRVNLSELPDDVLPKAGTLLSAELEHNRVSE